MTNVKEEQRLIAFDEQKEFQVEIVTLLQFCGGRPARVETHNISYAMNWIDFQRYLTHVTSNWQAELLGHPGGFTNPGGIRGYWLSRKVKNGYGITDYRPIVSEDLFERMVYDCTFDLGDNEKMRIIHVSTLEILLPQPHGCYCSQ